MASRLVRVDDATTLRRVKELRYGVYVEELRFDHPDACHENRTLEDELDAYSTIYALVDPAGDPVATLRCTFLEDLPDPTPLVQKFSMGPFLKRFGLRSLATTSRFMFRANQRKSTDILKLLSASVALALGKGVRFNFGDTNPIWLEYFERLGYRRYAAAINDPIFGFHLPIVMLLRDMAYLRQARSPTTRYAVDGGDDGEAREWFNHRYGSYAVQSPITRDPAPLGRVVDTLGLDPAALGRGCLGELSAQSQSALLAAASAVEVHRGDLLIRPGEVDDTAYVCLKGCFSETGTDGERFCQPGDIFGMEGYCTKGQRNAAVATADGLVLVLTARLLRDLSARHPEIGQWLSGICLRS